MQMQDTSRMFTKYPLGCSGGSNMADAQQSTEVRTLTALPADLLAHCFTMLEIRALGRVSQTCRAIAEIGMRDQMLWETLHQTVWLDTPLAVESSRKSFVDRYRQYCRVCEQRFDETAGPWLKDMSGHLNEQILRYQGSSADAHHDHSVGCAVAKPRPAPPPPFEKSPFEGSWPVCAASGVHVKYWEAAVVDAGEKGFVAVGWARDGYDRKCRQPGWDAHTYGYHGDDGRCYHHSGFGKPSPCPHASPTAASQPAVGALELTRALSLLHQITGFRFAPGPFTVGQTVGSGCVILDKTKRGLIFYTVDGIFMGIPFANVTRPGLLLPTIGLHSPGESVRTTVGADPALLLMQGPPLPPAPFQFDLNRFISSELLPCLEKAEANVIAEQERTATSAATSSSSGALPPAAHRVDVSDGVGTDPTASAHGSADDRGALTTALTEALRCVPTSVSAGSRQHEEEEDENADSENEGGEESDSDDDDSDVDPAEIMQQELEEIANLVNAVDDDSEPTLSELRFFARSRLGPQADNLHASWGASTVDGLNADQVRHLCWLLLAGE